MIISKRFKAAAAALLASKGNLTVVVSKTQNWNTQALVCMGDLQTLIKLPTGTNLDSGTRGTFRKMEPNEVKYSTVMMYAK